MEEFKNEMKYIDSSMLFVDMTYQRPLEVARVKKIVSNYNPNLVNPVKVSYRDGKYWIFDGQHTDKALVLNNGNKDLPVLCKVHYGMTQQDEARLFSQQFGLSKSPEVATRFNALYVAGDSEVIVFKNAVEETGLRCTFKKSGVDGDLLCYKLAFGIFTKCGESHFKEVLRIIIESWDKSKDSLKGEIVGGVDLFLRAYKTNEKYDRKRLVSKLSMVTPIEIIRNGRVARTGGNKRFARQILSVYNENLKKNQLDDVF